MNASEYSEDEYSQSTESMLQQIEMHTAQGRRFKQIKIVYPEKQYYNKLHQHIRQAIEKQVNLHCLNLFFLIFLTGSHPCNTF